MTVQLYPHLPGDGSVRSFFQHLLHRGDGADGRLDDAVALGCLGEDPAQVRGKALQARSGILDVRHAEGAGGFGLFKRLLVGVEPRRFLQLADVAHDRTGAYPVGSRAPCDDLIW